MAVFLIFICAIDHKLHMCISKRCVLLWWIFGLFCWSRLMVLSFRDLGTNLASHLWASLFSVCYSYYFLEALGFASDAILMGTVVTIFAYIVNKRSQLWSKLLLPGLRDSSCQISRKVLSPLFFWRKRVKGKTLSISRARYHQQNSHLKLT